MVRLAPGREARGVLLQLDFLFLLDHHNNKLDVEECISPPGFVQQPIHLINCNNT
jgi:hypothetical protein